MNRQVSVDGARYDEALVGSSDRNGAKGVAAMLVACDPSGAYSPLIAAANRPGDARAVETLAAEPPPAAEPNDTQETRRPILATPSKCEPN